MKRTSVSKQVVGLDTVALPKPLENSSLNVCFLYQDAAAKKWAKEAAERVTLRTGEESLRATWWKMADLAQPGVLAGAVSVAMRADVLVIALNSAERLPYSFYAWVESWLPNRYLATGALLVLMGNPNAGGTQTANTREYLRAVAHIGRLQFCLEERTLPALDRPTLPEAPLANGSRAARNGARRRQQPNLVCLPSAAVCQ